MHIRRNVFLIILLIIILNPLTSFSQPQEESLYKRLGGVNSIAAVADDFVDRLLADPVITANQNVVSALGKITKPGLKYQITELFCQSAGGLQKYSGRSMKESHQGLNITETEWQAMMKDFLATLAKFNIKESEQNELLIIVGGTKGDIVASAPQVVQPQVPGEPTSAVVIPQPSSPLTPSAIPQVPSLPTLPGNPALPPLPQPEALPNPNNLIPAPPQLPALPPIPAPQAAPQTPAPSIPNPINPPSQIPAIPELPKPADLMPQIPTLPEIPTLPNPVVPSEPSTVEPAPELPPPAIDSVQPKLELPSSPPAEAPSQVQPQAETPPDSDLPSQETAPTQNDLPPEADLEPLEPGE